MVNQAESERIKAAEAETSLCLNRLPYHIRARICEFTGAELKVWIALLSHANKDSRRAWVGYNLLMRETGLSYHGVKEAIRGLRQKGWISRYQTVDPKTGQRTTASTFCKWPKPVDGTPWQRILRLRKEEAE